jgi:hypothetical protein
MIGPHPDGGLEGNAQAETCLHDKKLKNGMTRASTMAKRSQSFL